MAASHDLHFPMVASTRLARWVRAFAASIAATGPHWLVILAYAAAVTLLAVRFDEPIAEYLIQYCWIILGFSLVGVSLGLLVLLLRIALVERAANPSQRMLDELRRLLAPENAARAFVLFVGIALLQDIYASFKPLIPRFVPYSWDPVFSAVDRALFLGHDPWRVLWPLLGNPVATWLLSTLYNLWFFWMLLVWVLVAFSTTRRFENLRYFLAVAITWAAGGTVMATIFSSVGPCYFGNFDFGPNPYGEQMAGLMRINQTLPVYALAVQDVLWHGQMNPVPGVLAGISAFPSMHVASAVLRTRIAYSYSRFWGTVSAVATALIYLGSIHLGWHYAVDGIAGALVALAAWWISGPILRSWARLVDKTANAQSAAP